MNRIISLLIILILITSVQAKQYRWDHNGYVDNLWSNPENWYCGDGYALPGLPGIYDQAFVRTADVQIDLNDIDITDLFVVAVGSPTEVITGSLTLDRDTVVNIRKTLKIGLYQNDEGYFYVKQGIVNVGDFINIARDANSKGQLQLEGGTVICEKIYMANLDPGSPITAQPLINIQEGVLYVRDGGRPSGKGLREWIDNGWLTGYGSASKVFYDRRGDLTKIWAEQNPPTGFSGGNGSYVDPFIITTASQITDICNDPNLWHKSFKLESDIDMTGHAFSPIGSLAFPFNGVFDGNNHTVSNITYTESSSQPGLCAGMFGYVGRLAFIKNLKIKNVTINVSGSDAAYVGGLAGINNGAYIEFCTVSGSIAGDGIVGGFIGKNLGFIDDCSFEGQVQGSGIAGGFAGRNDHSLDNCYAYADVISDGISGGLIGLNEYTGQVDLCFAGSTTNSNDIAGGLVGFNYEGSIDNTYAKGGLDAPSAGGLVGLDIGGTVENSYAADTINANAAGGLTALADMHLQSTTTSSFWDIDKTAQQTSAAGGTGLPSSLMDDSSTYTSAGWDFATIWRICEDMSPPNFQWYQLTGDLVCPDGINLVDLAHLASQWYEDDCTIINDYCNYTDINQSGMVDVADLQYIAESWLKGI